MGRFVGGISGMPIGLWPEGNDSCSVGAETLVESVWYVCG